MSNFNYPILADRNNCTACGGCFQVCTHQAIIMQPDEKGFLYPLVDSSKCVLCRMCERVCPVVSPRSVKNGIPKKSYACWHKDKKIRMLSSSGGFFSAIAEYIINLGGIVWGAAYTAEMKVTYQYVDKIENLDLLRRSKYVQCEVGNAFVKIKQQLNEGNTVLFTGTSCHINGLLAFLENNKKLGNLITVDFVCHGVPSPKVFKSYLDWIEKRFADKLEDFNFRDKRYGCYNGGILTVGKFIHKGKKVFVDENNGFLLGMYRNLYLRPVCYQCKSNGLQRNADFTIGDFANVGKSKKYRYGAEKVYGISLVVLNSLKAEKIFESCDLLVKEERCLEEAYMGNYNYRYSTPISSMSLSFWNSFLNANLWEDVLSYTKLPLLQKIKLYLKLALGPKLTRIVKSLKN